MGQDAACDTGDTYCVYGRSLKIAHPIHFLEGGNEGIAQRATLGSRKWVRGTPTQYVDGVRQWGPNQNWGLTGGAG